MPGKKDNFLVVRNPSHKSLKPLPNAEREARFVANILDTTPVLKWQATKGEILHRMKSAKIIHLAMHAGSRHLACAGSSSEYDLYDLTDLDCKLLSSEIDKLNLRAELVVLCCCGSERCDIMDAFISAGASCVICSLWPRLGDESACIFMQLLYWLLIAGVPISQANNEVFEIIRAF